MTESKATQSPHDALFKFIFEDPDNAAGELRALVPEALAERIAWERLALAPGTYVDEALAHLHSDLLFAAPLRDAGEVLVYLLFEHQSHADPLMPFRMLRYMVRIWERWLDSHPGAARLPAIIPVMLFHGAGGWTAATQMTELIDLDGPALQAAAPHVPSFQLLIDDLSRSTDETLLGRAMTEVGRLVLLLFKHARAEPKLLGQLEAWLQRLGLLFASARERAALVALSRYILVVNQEAEPTELANLLERVGGKLAREVVVTAGQQLIEQGRKEGRQQGLKQGLKQGLEQGLEEGRQEGRQEGVLTGQRRLLLRQLEARFGPLSERTSVRINAAGSVDIERWAERLLVAATLDDVLSSDA